MQDGWQFSSSLCPRSVVLCPAVVSGGWSSANMLLIFIVCQCSLLGGAGGCRWRWRWWLVMSVSPIVYYHLTEYLHACSPPLTPLHDLTHTTQLNMRLCLQEGSLYILIDFHTITLVRRIRSSFIHRPPMLSCYHCCIILYML